MQGIEKELEELRLIEQELKKSDKFKKWELPGIILAIILLYFLILPMITGQPMF